jgi:hypothetical protein
MQLHYSTVNPDEQKRSICKVLDLMQVKAQRAGGAPESSQEALLSDAPKQAGVAPSGAPAVLGGAPNEKTGRALCSNRLIQFGFCGAGEGIRTLDVNLGKVALYH